MKKMKHLVVLVGALMLFSGLSAQNPAGLFGELASLKARSEGYMRLAVQDSDKYETSGLLLERQFLKCKIASEALILKMDGDLALYTGLFGFRTIRRVKMLDKAVISGTAPSDKKAAQYYSLLQVYKQEVDAFERAYWELYKPSPSKQIFDKSKSLGLDGLSGAAEALGKITALPGEVVAKIRESADKRRELTAALLEALRMEYPGKGE